MQTTDTSADRRSLWVGFLTLVAGLVLVLIVLSTFVAYEANRASRPTVIDRTQAVPQIELPRIGTDIDLDALARIDTSEPGRLVLDVRGVELTIEPAPSGSPLRIEGGFDANRFDVTTEYSTRGERGWLYELRVRPTGLFGHYVRLHGSDDSIRIRLPRDVPLSLEGSVETANTEIELADLWVVGMDLVFGVGEHRIAFSRPLLLPMRRLSLDAPAGELTLVELGNASPLEVRLSKRVGEACVDLRGAWQADTTLDVACGVGHCDFHEPADGDALVRVAGGAHAVGAPGLPVIDVNVTGVRRGSVEISRRLN